jgi:hypothetical protein
MAQSGSRLRPKTERPLFSPHAQKAKTIAQKPKDLTHPDSLLYYYLISREISQS